MKIKTKTRAFRLPTSVDSSLRAAALQSNPKTTLTAVLVRVLMDAIRNSSLPRPISERDNRQLEFLFRGPSPENSLETNMNP